MSTAAGNITIFHSPDLEPLLHHAAHQLAKPLSDPFAKEIIVVPHSDMVRYLKRHLSQTLGASQPGRGDGIVANVEFVYPRQLANASSSDLLGLSPSPWDAHRLTWSIAHVASTQGVSIPGFERAPLSVSRRAADLFDRYASHRPEMLNHWCHPNGVLAGDQLSWLHADGSQNWQQLLFAAVSDFVKTSSPNTSQRAALNMQAFQRAVESAAQENGLPERITIFGVNALSRSSRQVLEVLSQYCAISIYMVFAPHSSIPQFSETGIAIRPEVGIGTLHHSLYKRWGIQAIEGAAGITQLGPCVPLEPQPRSDSLLHRLQHDIISDINNAATSLATNTTLMGDGSIQIHACYGLTRQAEAVRDALLHLFNKDASLRLRDVAILCSDLDASAPVLNAVLNPPASQSQNFPSMNIDVLGTTADTADSLSEAFFSLLRLTVSRCSPSEIIDVASLPPVSRHFGFTNDDIDLLTTWSQQLAVKYGLDAKHRNSVGSISSNVREGTWQSALERLFVGIAVPAEVERIGPGGLVPYDGIVGNEIDTAGRLAEFLERLKSLIAKTSSKGLTINDWREVVMSIVDGFLSVNRSDTEKFVRLKATLATIGEDALASGASVSQKYPIADLMSLTTEYFNDAFSVFGSKSEAITVTSMSNLQHLPYRVIVMFGADESAFAGAHSDGDDVLSNTPCVGEPIYSLTGRQTLLNALMSARDALIFTCTGADVSNNKQVPLAVPLHELVTVIGQTISTYDISGSHRVVTQHSRQNFDPRTLTPGVVIADQPFTFDTHAITALEAIKQRATTPSTHDESHINLAPTPQVRDLSQLVRAITNPSEFFIQNIVNVTLPRMPELSSNRESTIIGDAVMNITTDKLQDSQEGRELLTRVVRHAYADGSYKTTISNWRELHPKTGTLPPGELGKLVVSGIANEVETMIAQLPADLCNFPRGTDIDCIVDSPSGPISLRIPSVIKNENSRDLRIVRARFKRFTESVELEVWLEVAALTVHHNGATVNGYLLTRESSDRSQKDIWCREIQIAGDSDAERLRNAQEVMRCAFAIFAAAASGPLPLFEHASIHLAKGDVRGAAKKYETDFERSSAVRFLYDDTSFSEIMAIPLTDADRILLAPFGRGTGSSRAIEYAELLWQCFHATKVQHTVSEAGPTDKKSKKASKNAVVDDAAS